jgi:hypothetical protein
MTEFLNGTNPTNANSIFAFPPLHRYPYSNGFYAGPDVNLEWFGSSTLGRYQVEAAIWPDCTTVVYRGEELNMNAIGDPIVHPADLTGAIGTQCAYRVRAAFTNEAGWTDWSAWRPFKVLEPLDDHTLYLENGEPLRGCYFFFSDQPSNELASVWPAAPRNYSSDKINILFSRLNGSGYITNPMWKSDDALCSNDLSFIRHGLEYNTLFLDLEADGICNGGIGYVGGEYVYDTSYWPTSTFDRAVRLGSESGLVFLPWLSRPEWGGFNPPKKGPLEDEERPFAINHKYMSMRYLGADLLTDALYRTLRRFGGSSYLVHDGHFCLPDVADTNYHAVWAMFVHEFVQRYSDNTNVQYNVLLRVRTREGVIPVVAPMVELRPRYIMDFGEQTVDQFVDWCSNRYRSIACLNAAWDVDMDSFGAIDPVNQDGTVFKWDSDEPCDLRACDDFTEFQIERFVVSWFSIRDAVRRLTPVALAVENIRPLQFTHSGRAVPLYRINDFADIVVIRDGYDACPLSERIAVTDMQKSGKYVVFAGSGYDPTNEFGETTHYPFYALYAALVGGNSASYTWNELWDASGLVISLDATNGVHRMVGTCNASRTELSENASFESGTSSFVPGWTLSDSKCVTRENCSGIRGSSSLRFRGGNCATIESDPIEFNASEEYLLQFTLQVDYTCPSVPSVAAEVSIGAVGVDISFDGEGWDADPDVLLLTSSNLQLKHAELQAGHWFTFMREFDVGDLSGLLPIRITVEPEQGTSVLIDDVRIYQVP